MWALLAGAGALTLAGLAIYLTLAALPFAQQAVAEAGEHAGHSGGGGGFPLDFAAPFGGTRFAWAMRLALVGAAAAFLIATGRYFFADQAVRRGGRVDRWTTPLLVVVVGLAAASLAGSSLAGHASSLGGPLFAAIDWLHLVAVGAWLGTLPGLLLLVGLARRGERGQVAMAALGRHSRIALVPLRSWLSPAWRTRRSCSGIPATSWRAAMATC